MSGTGELMPCPRGRVPAAGPLLLDAPIRMAEEFKVGCPPEWDEARRRSAHAAIAGGGTRKELTVLERFQKLARESGGHGLEALPATPDTLAAFLADEADRGRTPAMLQRRIAAIRLAHLGVDAPCRHTRRSACRR